MGTSPPPSATAPFEAAPDPGAAPPVPADPPRSNRTSSPGRIA
ncbi:hypothetical protein OG889_15010 [Streptomyces sp. NBC_00481]|nr:MULTISPECIES: hypothetical protein [unclassified Streptomyces]WRY95933.1 hypothetical protein OG889_15010 [Streptomyces sp. NBC_00481]